MRARFGYFGIESIALAALTVVTVATLMLMAHATLTPIALI